MNRPTFLGVVLLSAVSALADVPSSQPVNTATPMDFIVSYDQLAGSDPAAYQAMYSMDMNDDTQRLGHVEARFDAQVGMLQKIVQQKWGEAGVAEVLHALGLKTLHDVQAGTVKETNGHASVIFPDGTPGPEMIKTPQGWWLDMIAFKKSLGVPVDEYLKQIRRLSKILPDLADGITEGKLQSSSAVVSEIAKRIDAFPQ